MIETNAVVDEYQFARTGLFSSEEEDRIMLVDINGIKVAYLSYSLHPSPGYNGKDKSWSQESVNTMLNIYTTQKAQTEIAKAKESGAEYVIVYMHWGVKNVFSVTEEQSRAAQELADAGVDFIVGGHSHLVQPYEEITAADGKVVPCYYSLGDFHSSINQIAGNRDSIIVRIRLQKDEGGKVELVENGFIPCFTRTSYGEKDFVVLPLSETYSDEVQLKSRDKFYERILSEVGDSVSEYLPEKVDMEDGGE